MPATIQERTDIRSRVQELNDELNEIDENRAAIKGQIEKAKADRWTTGEFADSDWLRRATGALRHLGVERMQVCRELGEANRRLRELNNALNDSTFHQAVREVVDETTYHLIIQRHKRITAEIAEGN